jgi:hypothetical protein
VLLARKTTDCNDDTVPAEAALTLIRMCPAPVFSAGLSAFASRAALTADIQSTQSMLLGPVHLNRKPRSPRSKGTSWLIITTLRIVRSVCLNSLKPDQRPIEGDKKKKNEKLYEGETCAHSNEITRREISVRIPYDQNS